MSKSIFASKTFWFNVGTGLVAVSNGALGFGIPPAVIFWVNLAGNTLLRIVTEQPVHIISE